MAVDRFRLCPCAREGSLLGNAALAWGSSRLNYSVKEPGRDFLGCLLPILYYSAGTCWGPLASPWLQIIPRVALPVSEGAGMSTVGFGCVKLSACDLAYGRKTGCSPVRNVKLFLSEVKNSPLGYCLSVYNFSFQEQTD